MKGLNKMSSKYNDAYIIIHDGKLCWASAEKEEARERAEMLKYQGIKRKLQEQGIENPKREDIERVSDKLGEFEIGHVNISGLTLGDSATFYSCNVGEVEVLVGDIVRYLKADRGVRFMKKFLR